MCIRDRLLLARLAGLETLTARTKPDLELDGRLQSAPLQYRDDTEEGFVDARLERLPGSFSVRFPDDDEVLRFTYDADGPGPGLHYEKQDASETTVADIQPLPANFNLCASSDDTCGSHGSRTVASINFTASETMQVNYLQRSTDGRKEIAIRDLRLSELALDAGVSSSASKGYIYVDTANQAFHGTFLQRDGDSGLYLQFSEGTHAEARRVRYKNFIQIDERSGTMQCPGREELEVRTGGVWIDFGFVLDQLCQ